MTTNAQQPQKVTEHSEASKINKIEHTVELDAKEAVEVTEKEAKTFGEFFTKFNNDWTMNLAGALAYQLLTAMFPIVIAFLSILGLFLGEASPATQRFFIEQLTKILPAQVSSTDVVNTILHKLPSASGILGVIAVLFAIFGGSRLFVLIDGCFNIIYQVHPRAVFRQNMMAIGMLLLFMILIPIMILASSGPALVLSNLSDDGLLLSLGGTVGSFIAAVILFAAIYVVVPNQHISIRNSWRGTLVAAVALQIYLTLFPLYATYFLTGYVGQVGFAIILLAFFYYFAIILLLGAQVNAFFAEGVRATPVDLAKLVHTYINSGKSGGTFAEEVRVTSDDLVIEVHSFKERGQAETTATITPGDKGSELKVLLDQAPSPPAKPVDPATQL